MKIVFDNLVFIIIALIAVGFGISFWWDHVRKKAIQKLVTDLGLECTPLLSPRDQQTFSRFALAQYGHGRSSSNAIVADTDRIKMTLFDHKYTTGGGKNQKTHRFSIAMIASDEIQAPDFELEPEHWYSKLAELLGRQDIDFDDDREFSSTFQLRGTNVAAIREFMTPTRRKALLAFPKLRIQVTPQAMIVSRKKYLTHNEIQPFMALALQVFDAIATPKS